MRTVYKWLLFVILIVALICSFGGVFNQIKSKITENRKERNKGDNRESPRSELGPRRLGELNRITKDYCHGSSPSGEEGILRDNTNNRYKLVQAHALFRHGDRTSESPLLQYLPPNDIECGLMDSSLEWRKLRSIKLKPHPSKTIVRNNKLRLFRGYKSQPCQKGHLTFVGFQQHSSLGLYFQSRYKDLVSDKSDKIFVQSTDMPRTIHSSAGFLVGFYSQKKKVPHQAAIHVSRGILLGAPPPKVHSYYPYCENLYNIRRQEYLTSSQYRRIKWNTTQTAKKLLKALHLNENLSSSITEVYDAFWPLLCHKKPNPCVAYACLNDSVLIEGARSAHLQYANKDPSNYSILASQPYLYHTVLHSMDSAITSISKGSEKYMRLSLSFGHDSNIAPLLATIGWKLDYWPSYASRVVMELWKDTSKTPTSEDDYYVRVLFNGRVISDKLPFGDENQFTAGKQLLKYNVWKNYLTTGPYREITSYIRHCRTSPP